MLIRISDQILLNMSVPVRTPFKINNLFSVRTPIYSKELKYDKHNKSIQESSSARLRQQRFFVTKCLFVHNFPFVTVFLSNS